MQPFATKWWMYDSIVDTIHRSSELKEQSLIQFRSWTKTSLRCYFILFLFRFPVSHRGNDTAMNIQCRKCSTFIIILDSLSCNVLPWNWTRETQEHKSNIYGGLVSKNSNHELAISSYLLCSNYSKWTFRMGARAPPTHSCLLMT